MQGPAGSKRTNCTQAVVATTFLVTTEPQHFNPSCATFSPQKPLKFDDLCVLSCLQQTFQDRGKAVISFLQSRHHFYISGYFWLQRYFIFKTLTLILKR